METTRQLLDQTVQHCDLMATCHYVQAEADKRSRILCGLPPVIISIVVGSLLVAHLGRALPGPMTWITALLALASSVFAAVQTFFSFEKRERGHRWVGNRFNRISRQLAFAEAEYVDGGLTTDEFRERLNGVLDEYEDVCRANEANPPSRMVAGRLKRQFDQKARAEAIERLQTAPQASRPESLGSASVNAGSADAVHHRLLYENAAVRVVETRIPPGGRVGTDTHCWPAALYVFSWSHFIRRDASGRVMVDSRKVDRFRVAPTALWSPPLPPHSVENVGGRELHIVRVEFKLGAR